MSDGTLKNTIVLAFWRAMSPKSVQIKALNAAGYSVVQVESRADFISSGQALSPQLVLIDQIESQDETRLLVQALDEEPGFSRSAIVFLTKHELVSDIERKAGRVYRLSTATPIPVFLERIREILRNRTPPSYACPEEPSSSVRVLLSGQIAETNEIGFVLSAPIKITGAATLDIAAPSFEELGLGSCFFLKTPTEASLVGDQFFHNEISVIGISPSSAEQLRFRSPEAQPEGRPEIRKNAQKASRYHAGK